jgi:NTE family protein
VNANGARELAGHGERREEHSAGPGWGLVLGGGGSVGSAYIAGALQALDEFGLDARSAGLVVGTSAGAFAGARIRLGDRPEALLSLAEATPDKSGEIRHFEPAWENPAELARRMVGTSGVLARAYFRAPLPLPPPAVSAAFPPGLFRVHNYPRVRQLLPVSWPEDPCWAVVVDLATGRRHALGSRPGHLNLPFRDAVMASCAVPGFYEPVRMNGTMYVDGGLGSSTHLDLAVRHGCHKVICIVPMGYQGGMPSFSHRVLRRVAVQGVRHELGRIGRRAQDVLIIQPPTEDLEVHGKNVLRGSGNEAVAERAYAQTRALLTVKQAARFIESAAGSAAALTGVHRGSSGPCGSSPARRRTRLTAGRHRKTGR